MSGVNRIKCENRAGFVLKFMVVWANGGSNWSNTFSNPESGTIDLDGFNISEGATLWIQVDAIGGKTKTSSQSVTFSPDTGLAVYKVKGGVDDYSITLESDSLESGNGAPGGAANPGG